MSTLSSLDANGVTWMPISTLDDFVHYLATGEDPHGRISADIVAEMNFPHASFTVTGKADFDHLRLGVSDRPWVVRVEPAEATPDGFLVVVEYDAHQAGVLNTFRTINVVSVEGEQITRLRHWCTGAL
jgi:hypothetical protein